MARMPTIDPDAGELLAGPFTELSKAIAEVALVADVATLRVAREFMATAGETFIAGVALVVPIAEARAEERRLAQEIELCNARLREIDERIDAMRGTGTDQSGEIRCLRGNRVVPEERLNVAIDFRNAAIDEHLKLNVSYQQWLTGRLFEIAPLFNQLQALMRQDLDVGGDFHELDEQNLSHLERAREALKQVTDLADSRAKT